MRLTLEQYEARQAARQAARNSPQLPVAAFSAPRPPQRRARLKQSEYIAEMAADKLENEVLADLLEWLTLKRIVHTLTEAKRSYNEHGQLVRRVAPGWPDVTAAVPLWRASGFGPGVSPGQLWGIEAKRATGGALSLDQAETLSRLWESGALVVIARSVECLEEVLSKGVRPKDLAEIREALRKGKNAHLLCNGRDGRLLPRLRP
jgi:hypothetical protein